MVQDALTYSNANPVEIVLLTDFFFHDCMEIAQRHFLQRRDFLKEFEDKKIYQTFGLIVAKVFGEALRISRELSLPCR